MLLLEQAAAIVGLVVIYHSSPFPVPSFRPFTCGFCTCFWLALGYFGWHFGHADSLQFLAGVGITSLLAGVVSSTTLLFRSSQPFLPPLPDAAVEPFSARTTRLPLLPPATLP